MNVFEGRINRREIPSFQVCELREIRHRKWAIQDAELPADLRAQDAIRDQRSRIIEVLGSEIDDGAAAFEDGNTGGIERPGRCIDPVSAQGDNL
jgi:hypothetical protein